MNSLKSKGHLLTCEIAGQCWFRKRGIKTCILNILIIITGNLFWKLFNFCWYIKENCTSSLESAVSENYTVLSFLEPGIFLKERPHWHEILFFSFLLISLSPKCIFYFYHYPLLGLLFLFTFKNFKLLQWEALNFFVLLVCICYTYWFH